MCFVFLFWKRVITSTTEGSRAVTPPKQSHSHSLTSPSAPRKAPKAPAAPPPRHLPLKILAAPRGALSCPSSHEVCLLAPTAMGAQQSVNAGKGHCSFLLIFFVFLAVFARVGNLLASLICSWKCRSQGGYASRPHPYAVRGAAAAAPQVLGTLPVREACNGCVRAFLFFSCV